MTKFPKYAAFYMKKEPSEIGVYLFYTTYSDGFLCNKLFFLQNITNHYASSSFRALML